MFRFVLVVAGAALTATVVHGGSGQQSPADGAARDMGLIAFAPWGPQQGEWAATQPAPRSPESAPTSLWEYRGVSSFFNIREANSNVKRGEWEFELTFEYFSQSGESDEFELAQSLKYGVTDEFHIELEVFEPLGEGGNAGAGDMRLTLFYQFLRETETLPAIGGFASMRIPSGDGSSGVDGRFSLIATKSFLDERLRFHLQGFVETVNGTTGQSDEDFRHFQWGVGPGIDFRIDDMTLVLLNYLHRVNPEEGEPNQNLLELGLVRDLGQLGQAHHGVKLALDLGLDGHESTPNFGAKAQWYVEW